MPRTERLDAQNPAHIMRAAELLRTGHTVAFPTETVYGLGANALDPVALGKIFEAKQRPTWDPLIVHIASRAQLPQIALANPVAERLMDRFWPGPLTLLLPRTSVVPNLVTAGRPLVGVRIPSHPVALALLTLAGIPIAAPSANTFSHTSPTTAGHVLADLDGRIDAVLDGGPTQVGLESTVAEITNQGVRVYRPGAIDVGMLETVVDYAESYKLGEQTPSAPRALPSPGFGIRHYAPRATLILLDEDVARNRTPVELGLVPLVDSVQTESGRAGVMLPDNWSEGSASVTFAWGPWHQPEVLASRLFAGLRWLDEQGATTIVCPVPYGDGISKAIADRLKKAAMR